MLAVRILAIVLIVAVVPAGTYGLAAAFPPVVAWLGGIILALVGVFIYDTWVLP